MSESCSGNCASCGSDCGERKAESLLAQLNPKSQVKKVIAVVSGKGGVGKSTVTAQLAVAMARKGHRVGILDADITGPSIPKAFGVSECQGADQSGLYPALTQSGIQVMSINLLPVSYTHLDVYKRQRLQPMPPARRSGSRTWMR